jgi:hypothetical protein
VGDVEAEVEHRHQQPAAACGTHVMRGRSSSNSPVRSAILEPLLERPALCDRGVRLA